MYEVTPSPELFKKSTVNRAISIDEITYVRYKSGANGSIYRANIQTHLLIIVLEGKKLIFRNREVLTIEGGEAFFLPVGSHLMSEITSELNSFKSLMFFISDNFINNFIKNNVKKTLYPYSKGYSPEVFKLDFNRSYINSLRSALPDFLENENFSSSLFQLKLTELLLMVISTKCGCEYFTYLSDQINNSTNKLVNYMETNFSKPYTIEEFANDYGKSLSAFKREFSLNYEESPKKWVNLKRLELASKLLKYSELNISDICNKVGFSNLSYFIQLFKNRYGITPKSLQLDFLQQK